MALVRQGAEMAEKQIAMQDSYESFVRTLDEEGLVAFFAGYARRIAANIAAGDSQVNVAQVFRTVLEVMHLPQNVVEAIIAELAGGAPLLRVVKPS